tara:strand:- start:415202 stop:420907 length:5706 start_codon:yes stop_codon:yes gene_type:complete
MASYHNGFDDALQLDPKTRFTLLRFDRRRRRLILLRAAMVGVIVFVMCMFAIIVLDYFFFLSDVLRWTLSGLGYATTILVVWYTGLNRYAGVGLRQLARQLESVDPQVRDDVLSAVELSDPSETNGSQYFRDSLQRNVAQRVAKIDVQRLLPIGLVRKWLSTGLVIALVCLVVSLIPSLQFARRLGRAALPGFAIQRASQTVIRIVKPEPPTGFVAEGDVVAVVADISGKTADSVVLRWRDAGGEQGETIMSPRHIAGDSELPADAPDAVAAVRYAANLSFSDQVLHYQLVAGDAITLWHSLTPLPRPRTKEFRVRYEFPEYTQLHDRVEVNSHGDLQAFVGTKAEVTVTFDQPVSEASVRFVGRDVTFPMEPVDGSSTRHKIVIPVRLNGQYQVNATGMESGLGNPFSPTYSISPVPDIAPKVQWQSSDLRSLLASPIDVLPLAVSIQDDMPLSTAAQEYSVNGQRLIKQDLQVDQPGRDIVHDWDWDLTMLADGQGEPIHLSPGDIVRTRVIATDRRGQTSSSSIVDILIADEGFDSDRHDRLMELADISRQWRQWIQQGQVLASTAETGGGAEPDSSESLATWSAESERLIDRIADHLQQSRSSTEASNVELLGHAVADLTRTLTGVSTGDVETVASGKQRKKQALASSLQKDADRVSQMLDSLVGHSLTLSVAGDAILLRNSLQPIVDVSNTVSASRIPRYLKVANDRLKAIRDLIDSNEELLPQSTQRHFQGDGWTTWSNQWSQRLDDVVNENAQEQTLRRMVHDFHEELSSRVAHSLVDGRLASTNAKLIAEVRQQISDLSDALRQANDIGKLLRKTEQEVDREKSPVLLQQRKEQLADVREMFSTYMAELQSRVDDEADLHRQRPVVDLRYAADLGLLSQAIKSVSSDGYRAYHDIPPDEVYTRLANAIEVIENVHHASRLHRQLASLRDAERDFVDNASSKISHSFWLDQYRVGLQSWAKRMRKHKVLAELVRPLDQVRQSPDFNHAKNRIDGRRWSKDPPISAFVSLGAVVHQSLTSIDAVQSDVQRAREEILEFVKTLSEQAREAARLAAEAAKRSDDNQDATQPQTASLAEQQRDAESAAKETIDRLHDRANTVDLTDEKQRELAHDADLSAAAVESALRRAKESMQLAKSQSNDDQRRTSLQENGESLAELSETLQQVANHFEQADQGLDASESREALRQAIEESRLRDEADMRQRRAEAIAKAAESDPEEMLRRLESQLKDDPVMQDELSDITSRALDAALNKLRQASEQEQAVQQSLERSDPAIAERKKRMNASVRNAAMQIAGIDDANMNAAERTVDLGQNGTIRQQLGDVRKQLQQAVAKAQSTGGDQSLLSELSATATEVADALRQAKDLLQNIQRDVDDIAGKNESIDPPLQAAQRVKQIDNARRNTLIRSITNEQRAWTNAVRETGPRLQQAQRKQRDAKDEIRRLDDPKSNKELSDKDAAKLQEARQRLVDATRAVDEAKKTNQFASEKASEAARRIRQVRTEKAPKLEPANLVNDAVQNMLESTRAEIDSVANELLRWQDENEDASALRASKDESSRLIQRQRDVEFDVTDAGEDIRRAGRHEERLEKTDVAESVQQIADAVVEQTVPATQQARESLQAASEDASRSSKAKEDLEDAGQQIDRTASLLQALLGQSSGTSPSGRSEQSPSGQAEQPSGQTEQPSGQAEQPSDQPPGQASDQPPGQSQPNSDEPSSLSEEQSRQLAKTLDELDRAMLSAQPPSQSQPPQDQSAQEGEQDAASSDSSSSSQGKPPSDPSSSSSSPQSAAEASPTLSSMLENEQQNAARQRRGQKPPTARSGQSQRNQPGEDPSEGASSIADMNDPTIDPSAVDRVGDDWGDLRRQAPEDVLQSEWSTVSPQYRREVSAYFRAIAERSVQEARE